MFIHWIHVPISVVFVGHQCHESKRKRKAYISRQVSVNQRKLWQTTINDTTVCLGLFVCLMVFNATFNNISVISWWSVLLVEETEGPGENYRPTTGHWQTLSNNFAHSPWSKFELPTSVVKGTDCIGSCKSNYHTTTATTAPLYKSTSYYPLIHNLLKLPPLS